VKENFFAKATWTRGFFMLVYATLFWVARIVIAVVVLFQFGSMLITGKINERLLGFGQSLSLYMYQIMRYLTYNTEEKPFPLSPWPQGSETAAPDLLKDKNEA
jgi:hypothetical protein